MKTSEIIKIVNAENHAVYITNDTILGEALRNGGIIDIHSSTLISEKTRKGKQVLINTIDYHLIEN